MPLKIFTHSVSKSEKKNLIIFIHGFNGGAETWIRKDKEKSILNYLQEDANIIENYDFAVFDYFTEPSDKFHKIKGDLKSLFGSNDVRSRNIDITNIAQILKSEIRYIDKDYVNIVLIGHSMGGLVAKSLILEVIRENSFSPFILYISLAVPHKGSNLAVLGKAILGNPQIENLNPLSNKIDQLTDDWLTYTDLLPETVYFQGKFDDIVPNTSSKGIDNRDIEIVYSDDDHFTIVRPKSEDDVIIRAVKSHLKNLPNYKKENQKHEKRKLKFKSQYHEEIWNSLNGLRVYFDSKMGHDLQRTGKINPEPVFNFINKISESKLFIEDNLYNELGDLYTRIAAKSNKDIAEPIIEYFNNRDTMTMKNQSIIEQNVNKARLEIVSEIESFLNNVSKEFI